MKPLALVLLCRATIATSDRDSASIPLAVGALQRRAEMLSSAALASSAADRASVSKLATADEAARQPCHEPSTADASETVR